MIKYLTWAIIPLALALVAGTLLNPNPAAAASATTTTLQAEIYAYFFDQKGLMAGLGLQGTKITKINK